MVAVAVVALCALPSPAVGQSCASVRPGVFLGVDGTIGPAEPAPSCLGAFYCKKPELSDPAVTVEFVPDPSDPTRQGSYRIRAVYPFLAAGNNQNDGTGGTTTDFRVKFHVFGDSAPPVPDCFPGINACSPIGTCGIPGGSVPYDEGEVTVEIAVRCEDLGPGGINGVSLTALRCATPAGTCNTRTDSAPVTLPDLRDLGLYCPPKPNCCEQRCEDCKEGGDVGGGAGSYCPLDRSTGNARLAFAAGGPGTEEAPGGTAWRTSLGRGWSHDYAERIVEAPDDTHVWLITKTGNFHEFWSPVGGVYQGRAPADEYRTLSRTASGWELRGLDGTVQSFGADGRWEMTVDASGNATTASYDGAGVLTGVSFADGRSETLSYHPDGKLASITHVGVDAVVQRSWSYTWSGDRLTRIDRPDGTAEEHFYNDGRFPGYLTRIDELGTDGSRRVKKAWEYDAEGNTVRTWRGETVPGGTGDTPGPGAVGVWSFGFDDPVRPTETLVTDPLGGVATYAVSRDPQSGKTKVVSISGDCPTCGLGPNTRFFYDDPVNRMLPTRTVDGRGTTTLMSYDANGRMTSRTEALGTPEERTTSWTYGDPAFPDTATEIERPSTSPGSMRRTTMVLDAAGNPTQTTFTGVEAGSAFSYTTTATYTASGQPETVDPPGYATADVTSFSYDPARGNLLPLSRTDPLVGTTSFAYDALNRLTATTDPNGVSTEVAYDPMDRVTVRTDKGATPAGDLVTENQYNAFGDLERTILPEGNVIEYEYDAVGRLVSIARGPAPGVQLERAVFELDAAANVTNEKQQRWTGSAWETASETTTVYATRCQVDRIVQAPGTTAEAVTEYAYDCNGNVESVWDANHTSAADPPTQSFLYDALDRLTSISSPWAGPGGGSAVTTYRYDVQDHPVEITDAEGNTTTYVYSDRDLLTAETSPVSGARSLTYNEHGEPVSETDGRGVTVLRTVDAADRPTFLDTPENALDTTFTWDDPAVGFSKGRLTAIGRNGKSVFYAYDRFGRTVQDGLLGYSYDDNGNQTTITYPGGVSATYEYDFADRHATLSIADGTTSTPLVTGATYHPSGPLASLSLGNGTSEVRAVDRRYYPESITVPGLLDWTYTTDGVGNVLSIADALAAGDSRTFGYQDNHYFLTSGDGPWGELAWTYDKIGDRLTETRDGATSSYSYAASAAGGRSPRLSQVTAASGAASRFFFDAAGNQTYEAKEATKRRYGYDALGRLSQVRVDAPDSVATRTAIEYDGRGYLCRATLTPFPGRPATVVSEPTYASDGIPHHFRTTEILAGDDPRPGVSVAADRYVFYFAARPVFLLSNSAETATDGTVSTSSQGLYLATDHLGTPVLATDAAGSAVWQGGFEPFGADHAGAADAGVFLRLPGQWQDPALAEGLEGLLYNLNRWYLPTLGRYSRTDPWGADQPNEVVYLYAYADSRPLNLVDRWGLLPAPPDDFFDCAYCLFERSKRGLSCTEQAAWIGLGSPGGDGGVNLECIVWPKTGDRGKTSWSGPIPPNAVGQAHTHPTRCPDRSVPRGPRPSEADQNLANGKQSTNFRDPVCTISASGIWCHSPGAKKPKRVAGPGWWKEPKKRNCEPCDGITVPD